MPEYYEDWWWEDLPPKAKRAAGVMGYTQAIWDGDEDVPYDSKGFSECTLAEKRAAMYLGMKPLDYKLDVWWEETDAETQKHAKVLGFDKHKWDDDWEIQDLPCEHWYWKDMSDEQKRAAEYFGYSRCTWDETDDDDDVDFDVSAVPTGKLSQPDPQHQAAAAKYEEETDSDEEPIPEQSAEAAAAEKKKRKENKKKKLQVTKYYGGDGGGDFDHQNNRSITELTVFADGHVVNGLSVLYWGNFTKEDGDKKGKEHKLELGKGEYITKVKVRSNQLVQSLEFTTNKGNTLGPAGGEGWKLPRRDKCGEMREVEAPPGCQLCGFKGRAGAHLDAIAFRWGPVPGKSS